MHAAGMRRVPAERARHAKRLGHVQRGSGPAYPIILAGVSPTSSNGATTVQSVAPSTTSSPTPAPATSTTHSSSSAPAPSSSTSSSPSALTSAATSSTSSVASSTDTRLLTSPVSSSPAGTPPTVLSSTLPTLSTTTTPTPQPHTSAAQNSRLSGGAIAGIIAGGAIVGAAIIVFFIRKTYLRRRERKRISWTGAPGLGAGIADEPKPFPDSTERRTSFSSATNTVQRNVPQSPFAAYGQTMYSAPVSPLAHTQPPMPTYTVPTPPPATYNNPASVATYATHPVPSAYGLGNPPTAVGHVAAGTGIPPALSPPHAQRAPMEATVRCTFVPTLPDELSITTGERVFILERYDDGWDLCANARGERGMVPRECLEQAPIDQPDVGWRNVGRASSLNPDGGRY